MKKLLVALFLLFAMSASAQQPPMCLSGSFYVWEGNNWKCNKGDIVEEAQTKIEVENRKALVKYAQELLRKIAKYERKVTELRKALAKVESGEFKAHQIPKGCEACITLGSTTNSLIVLDN